MKKYNNNTYKVACKAAVAYKNGYIKEKELKNVVGNYVYSYINDKLNAYVNNIYERIPVR